MYFRYQIESHQTKTMAPVVVPAAPMMRQLAAATAATAAEEDVKAVLEDIIQNDVWAAIDARSEEESAAAVTEALKIEPVVAETPVLATAAAAAVGSLLEDGREEVEEEVEEEEETEDMKLQDSAEVPSSRRGRRWAGVHVGVWLTIGAGVAVGAALWARRR